MKQIVIENPIINSPFEEPKRHFRFTDEGITNEIVEERRKSSYFIPIPQPKKRGKQLTFDTEWTQDRVEENKFINRVRERVAQWRQGGYVGITKTSARLLEHWQNPERERKLFFCQIEALETAIYITEVAKKFDPWIENDLRTFNGEANPLLFRLAFKMATGSGKTVVMAMLISWHVLNKLANNQDARFSDTFLLVAPGITIRDRLRVLLPNDSENYYRKLDLVPADMQSDLGKSKILITNFHAFKLREKISAGKLTKVILSEGEQSPFTETPDEMVRRVCREFGNKKNIIVINDEAHHCYRRKADGVEEGLKGTERKEAEKREEEARVWISGVEAIKQKIGVKAVYDLSATPFFLRGSGYPEGTLFKWVVSDFSLIDAIESGIVKVPRVPVADNSMVGDQPTYRDLWLRIREDLPKKGRGTKEVTGEPKLPAELEGAIQSLYDNYEKYYRLWEDSAKGSLEATPPVFIVVCNNTNVSKMIFDYIAGWEKELPDGGKICVPGKLAIFSNVADGQWTPRPNSILVDSEQLESGESMSAEFKKVAAHEIEEFKQEYRMRFPGRSTDELTDEDLLREVMNTVGKPGKLGERVKCVVSVSMLTEGWDANTVTHILGVRAFGTQLLCEQVVGRGLRRMSYVPGTVTIPVNGKTAEFEAFPVEYAEVYGVPFSFIPCAGTTLVPKPGPEIRRVRALEERIACEITFPRLTGYKYELPAERLAAEFGQDSRLILSTADIPTKTENAPIIGESSIHTLEDLQHRRENEVVFLLSKLVLEKYFLDEAGTVKPWLFPQLLQIARRWLAECVVWKDNTFPQLILLIEFAYAAAEKIYRVIVAADSGEKRLKPIPRPFETIGSTRYVDFNTTKPTYQAAPDKCHVSHVAMDSNWEAKMAAALEDMVEVMHYIKNQGLGFTIPYTLNGEERNYLPDYIVRVKNGGGQPLNLVIEVTGEKKKDKEAKVATAREYEDNIFRPGNGYWKTNEIGMARLKKASRIAAPTKNSLTYVRFLDDFPVSTFSNVWSDTQTGAFTDPKVYVVQTNTKVIERCLLMTTDPGDLVLDPTCGSGTTAYVAEQWGRRWITCDTSRVALALARTRLMAAKFPYYYLADSPEGVKKEAEIAGKVPPEFKTEGDIRKGFVYKRVSHITLKAIANNAEIDNIHAKWQVKIEPTLEKLNKSLKKSWKEWEVPRESEEKWPKEAKDLLAQWWELRLARQQEIDASIARNADTEVLFDQPFDDNKRIRVTGPLTIESLSPHRVLATDEERPESEREAQRDASVGQFETMILDNLKKAGVQNTRKSERLKFDRLESYAGAWLHAAGEFTDNDGQSRRVAVCIGPEHGTVTADLIKDAAKEAVKFFDMLIICGFAFDAHASETAKEITPAAKNPGDFIVAEEERKYGRLPVLLARMNPDLAMGDELLKSTGVGNLFMVFGEPDVDIQKMHDKITVDVKGVDVYDPTTGQIRSSSTDDIACWFIDTNYNGESFFVRHAYFTGAQEPYNKLKRALRAEIDEAAWSSLYSTVSRPFDQPKTGKIAIKVINHYGDEVLKVFEVR